MGYNRTYSTHTIHTLVCATVCLHWHVECPQFYVLQIQDLQTNAKRKFSHGEYHDRDLLFARTEGYIMNKGDHIGGFNFGSTIVLAFEAPEDFKFLVQAKDKVKYGEALGSL